MFLKDCYELTNKYYKQLEMKDLKEHKKDLEYLNSIKERFSNSKVTLKIYRDYSSIKKKYIFRVHDYSEPLITDRQKNCYKYYREEENNKIERTFKDIISIDYYGNTIRFNTGFYGYIGEALEISIKDNMFALFNRLDNNKRLLIAYGSLE